MRIASPLISMATGLALVAVPLTPASAHGRHHDGGGLLFGLAALGTAAVVGVATIATAPVRALAAATEAPPPPPPAYYAPQPYYAAPPPVYYAPPQAYYYAAPPGYYGR